MNLINGISEMMVWPVLALVFLGVGVYFTIRMGFAQFRYFPHALEILNGKYDHLAAEGEVSHKQALHTALAASIGTGNIAGVGTAIAVGGPGAVLWMWVSAFFGMIIHLISATLAVQYRKVAEDGTVRGGPMYYLEHGCKKKWLGVIYAVCALLATFGIGNLLQANSVAEPLEATMGIPKIVTGLVLGGFVWFVIVGGIRRVGWAASKLVPFMAMIYIAGGLGVVLLNYRAIPAAFLEIFHQAIHPTAAMGGFAGAAVVQTFQVGVIRGFFTHEAGLGSSAIAHATAKTDEPVRQGIVAMLGPCIDTILICTITALVVVMTGGWRTGLTGVELTAWAFQRGLPGVGEFVVTFGMVFFALTTAISWSYYGETALSYLGGSRLHSLYRWAYTLALPIGATLNLGLVWTLADLANGLMALPNLVGILGLSGVVRKLLKDYQARGKGVKKGDEGRSVVSEGY